MLRENIPSNWAIGDAVLPGRDIYVSSSALSGVFISIKEIENITFIEFNVCPPIFFRGALRYPL